MCGQNDSNLEVSYHGDVLMVRWHWGALGIDHEKPLDEVQEATLRSTAKTAPFQAAVMLAGWLEVQAPQHALERLGQQLNRWAR